MSLKIYVIIITDENDVKEYDDLVVNLYTRVYSIIKLVNMITYEWFSQAGVDKNRMKNNFLLKIENLNFICTLSGLSLLPYKFRNSNFRIFQMTLFMGNQEIPKMNLNSR